MRRTDGSQQIERFNDVAAFRSRIFALEKELDTERWKAVGSQCFSRMVEPDVNSRRDPVESPETGPRR
jgi:hypothetical protein